MPTLRAGQRRSQTKYLISKEKRLARGDRANDKSSGAGRLCARVGCTHRSHGADDGRSHLVARERSVDGDGCAHLVFHPSNGRMTQTSQSPNNSERFSPVSASWPGGVSGAPPRASVATAPPRHRPAALRTCASVGGSVVLMTGFALIPGPACRAAPHRVR